MGIRESWWDAARFEPQGSDRDLHPYILGLERRVLGKNLAWRRINLSKRFIPPQDGGAELSSWDRKGKKKTPKKPNPKIGCFAKGAAEVPELRAAEQGQEVEAGARGRKM